VRALRQLRQGNRRFPQRAAVDLQLRLFRLGLDDEAHPVEIDRDLGEPCGDLGGGAQAGAGLRLEQLCEQRLEPAAASGARLGERLLAAGEAAGQHFEEHPAEGVEVGRRLSALGVAKLLGRGIGRREAADERALAGGVGLGESRQAEVGDLGLALPVEQDVLRLEVAVDDALGVNVGERFAELPGDTHRIFRRQRLASELLAERGAGDQLDGQPGQPLVEAGVDQADDPRVHQLLQDADLVAEAGHEGRLAGPRIGDALERGLLAREAVPSVEHLAHRAGA
jgi:hypothetical protein